MHRVIADRVARKLLADLKAGKLTKIDVIDVRLELALDLDFKAAEDKEGLVTLTLRRLVEMV